MTESDDVAACVASVMQLDNERYNSFITKKH